MAGRPARAWPRLLVISAATAAAASAASAAALRRTYASTTALDGARAALHWTLRGDSIDLALVITAAAVVTPAAGALWVGFGIGDPQSGGMAGADIVTAEFGGGGSGANCTLVDRHVPMAAHPLGSAVGGAAVFPVPDDCPSKASWALAACAVDVVAGTLTLEASRSLAAPDAAQDRPIVAGRNTLLYAYGNGFSYHGPTRRAVEVDLSAPGTAAVVAGDLASTGDLPPDADGAVTLTMPNYTVAAVGTDYGCAAFEVPAPPPGRAPQMIAAEALVDRSSSGGRLVHHLVLLLCRKTPEFDTWKAGRSCRNVPNFCGPESVFGCVWRPAGWGGARRCRARAWPGDLCEGRRRAARWGRYPRDAATWGDRVY